MKRRFLLLASIAAVSLTGVATAQRGPGAMMGPQMGPMGGFALLQHDANADGKLTRAEFDTALRARFNEFDANRDGAATAEEMQAARKVRMEKAQADRFARIDTDKNGQISPAEMQAARSPDAAGQRGGGRGWGRGPGRGGPGGRGGDGDGPRGDRTGLGPMDADKDGRLTYAEFTARPVEAFTRADTDKNGTVTIAELQAQRPVQR